MAVRRQHSGSLVREATRAVLGGADPLAVIDGVITEQPMMYPSPYEPPMHPGMHPGMMPPPPPDRTGLKILGGLGAVGLAAGTGVLISKYGGKKATAAPVKTKADETKKQGDAVKPVVKPVVTSTSSTPKIVVPPGRSDEPSLVTPKPPVTEKPPAPKETASSTVPPADKVEPGWSIHTLAQELGHHRVTPPKPGTKPSSPAWDRRQRVARETQIIANLERFHGGQHASGILQKIGPEPGLIYNRWSTIPGSKEGEEGVRARPVIRAMHLPARPTIRRIQGRDVDVSRVAAHARSTANASKIYAKLQDLQRQHRAAGSDEARQKLDRQIDVHWNMFHRNLEKRDIYQAALHPLVRKGLGDVHEWVKRLLSGMSLQEGLSGYLRAIAQHHGTK